MHELSQDKNNQEISPETLIALNNTIDVFLKTITSEKVEEFDDGLRMITYDTSVALANGREYLNLIGAVIVHNDHGTVTKPLLRISHGSTKRGPGMSDDFVFYVENPHIETETGMSAADEVFSFTDTRAIDARCEELLANEELAATIPLRGVMMPRFEVTPAGDIHEDGQEFNDHQQFGAIGIGMAFRFDNDEQAANFQRQQAAHDQAREDIGTRLTDERAERVMELIAEAYSLDPQDRL